MIPASYQNVPSPEHRSKVIFVLACGLGIAAVLLAIYSNTEEVSEVHENTSNTSDTLEVDLMPTDDGGLYLTFNPKGFGPNVKVQTGPSDVGNFRMVTLDVEGRSLRFTIRSNFNVHVGNVALDPLYDNPEKTLFTDRAGGKWELFSTSIGPPKESGPLPGELQAWEVSPEHQGRLQFVDELERERGQLRKWECRTSYPKNAQ